MSDWFFLKKSDVSFRRLHQIDVIMLQEHCAGSDITALQSSFLSLLRDLVEADQTIIANAIASDCTATMGAWKRLVAHRLVMASISISNRRIQFCRQKAEGAPHEAMKEAVRGAHE